MSWTPPHHTPTCGRRWPIEPLEDALRAALGQQRDADSHADPHSGFSVRRAADTLGVHRDSWHRWKRAGTLSDVTADHAAVALGLHPVEIWPDWHQPVLDYLDRRNTRPRNRRVTRTGEAA